MHLRLDFKLRHSEISLAVDLILAAIKEFEAGFVDHSQHNRRWRSINSAFVSL